MRRIVFLTMVLLLFVSSTVLAEESLFASMNQSALMIGQTGTIKIEGGKGPFKSFIGLMGDEFDLSKKFAVKVINKNTIQITAREPLQGEIIVRDAAGEESRFPIVVMQKMPGVRLMPSPGSPR